MKDPFFFLFFPCKSKIKEYKLSIPGEIDNKQNKSVNFGNDHCKVQFKTHTETKNRMCTVAIIQHKNKS